MSFHVRLSTIRLLDADAEPLRRYIELSNGLRALLISDFSRTDGKGGGENSEGEAAARAGENEEEGEEEAGEDDGDSGEGSEEDEEEDEEEEQDSDFDELDEEAVEKKKKKGSSEKQVGDGGRLRIVGLPTRASIVGVCVCVCPGSSCSVHQRGELQRPGRAARPGPLPGAQ